MDCSAHLLLMTLVLDTLNFNIRIGKLLPVISDQSSKNLISNPFLQDSLDGCKQLAEFRSFTNPNRRAIVQAPARSRSMLSALFVKPKAPKLRAAPVS